MDLRNYTSFKQISKMKRCGSKHSRNITLNKNTFDIWGYQQSF